MTNLFLIKNEPCWRISLNLHLVKALFFFLESTSELLNPVYRTLFVLCVGIYLAFFVWN